jgi:hypothetical protein
MAALTGPRQPFELTLKNIALPLAAQVVWQGGRACIDTSTGTVKKAAAANANLLSIGEFAESLDNTGALAPYVMVNLDREIKVRCYDSVTGANAVTISNLGSDCYLFDDHTVTMASSGNSKAGRVWGVHPVNGPMIQSEIL